eukprot:CAMPEP_0172072744 /NCGR_PEP_ID=MMETSP1043-20130122/14474_1 /TAXON_ID=464988 /ORGANISM="Hemiselmis andersenii, Strain CCMP441" /LENGTH=48 /DNA_ID= /DNA_START= /DNA_END= /DNA_ORIENTATION=
MRLLSSTLALITEGAAPTSSAAFAENDEGISIAANSSSLSSVSVFPPP